MSPIHAITAIERVASPAERSRAVGFAKLKARLVRRHILAPGLNVADRRAAWQALLAAEAAAGHPLPEAWHDWRVGAPALVAAIETAIGAVEMPA